MMPAMIDAAAGWVRPATLAAPDQRPVGAIHAVRRAVETWVRRAAPVPPVRYRSKEFQDTPEWRKFLCF
jgi:hypothetical protein